MILMTLGSKFETNVHSALRKFFPKEKVNTLRSDWLYKYDTPDQLREQIRSKFQPADGTLSGLILVGGADISPFMFRREYSLSYKNDQTFIDRDLMEFILIDHCVKSKIPILGICRGFQILCTYFGCTMIRDLVGNVAHSPKRFDKGFGDREYRHSIKVIDGGLLDNDDFACITNLGHIPIPLYRLVNSYHHQGVPFDQNNVEILNRNNVRVDATAPNDTDESTSTTSEIIEMVSSENIIAVQFHPEVETERSRINKKIFTVFQGMVQKHKDNNV